MRFPALVACLLVASLSPGASGEPFHGANQVQVPPACDVEASPGPPVVVGLSCLKGVVFRVNGTSAVTSWLPSSPTAAAEWCWVEPSEGVALKCETSVLWISLDVLP